MKQSHIDKNAYICLNSVHISIFLTDIICKGHTMGHTMRRSFEPTTIYCLRNKSMDD